MSASKDRTSPVPLQQLEPPHPPPRLARATRPPPIPPARRGSGTARAVLTITSRPPRATVMVVTAGRAQEAGLTPVRVDIDPQLHHDVIIAADGYDSIMWGLSPHAPRVIDVDLQLRVD